MKSHRKLTDEDIDITCPRQVQDVMSNTLADTMADKEASWCRLLAHDRESYHLAVARQRKVIKRLIAVNKLAFARERQKQPKAILTDRMTKAQCIQQALDNTEHNVQTGPYGLYCCECKTGCNIKQQLSWLWSPCSATKPFYTAADLSVETESPKAATSHVETGNLSQWLTEVLDAPSDADIDNASGAASASVSVSGAATSSSQTGHCNAARVQPDTVRTGSFDPAHPTGAVLSYPSASARPQRAAEAPDLRAGNVDIHRSHQTAITHGLVWCRVCGFYASLSINSKSHCVKLAEACKPPTRAGKDYMARLRRGLPPRASMNEWPDGTRVGAAITKSRHSRR